MAGTTRVVVLDNLKEVSLKPDYPRSRREPALSRRAGPLRLQSPCLAGFQDPDRKGKVREFGRRNSAETP